MTKIVSQEAPAGEKSAELSTLCPKPENVSGTVARETAEIKKTAMNAVENTGETENKTTNEIVEEVLPTMDETIRGWIRQYLVVTANQRGWKRKQIAKAAATITAYVEFLGSSVKNNRRNLSLAMQNLTQDI